MTEDDRRRNPAEWCFDMPCPNCEKQGHGGMIAVDKWGFFCVIDKCGWKRGFTKEELNGNFEPE